MFFYIMYKFVKIAFIIKKRTFVYNILLSKTYFLNLFYRVSMPNF